MEPANRSPAPGAGSVLLTANSSFPGEQVADGSLQPGPYRLGATYPGVQAVPFAKSQPIWPLKPTSKDSVPSESGVSI